MCSESITFYSNMKILWGRTENSRLILSVLLRERGSRTVTQMCIRIIWRAWENSDFWPQFNSIHLCWCPWISQVMMILLVKHCSRRQWFPTFTSTQITQVLLLTFRLWLSGLGVQHENCAETEQHEDVAEIATLQQCQYCGSADHWWRGKALESLCPIK